MLNIFDYFTINLYNIISGVSYLYLVNIQFYNIHNIIWCAALRGENGRANHRYNIAKKYIYTF